MLLFDKTTFSASDCSSHKIAVLPLGATEQHGPHLPLETDSLISKACIGRSFEKLQTMEDKFSIGFLPQIDITFSLEHMDFEGTQTLKLEEMYAALLAIGRQLHAQKIRRFIIMSAHGGNSAIMALAALALRQRYHMLCVHTNWMRFGLPEGWVDKVQKKHNLQHDIHGGCIETSLVMAIAPDKIKHEHLKAFPSRQAFFEENYKYLTAHGRIGFGWMMQDLNDAGVVGDTTFASAEFGQAILEHQTQCFTELVDDVARFDLTLFDRDVS